MKALLWCALAAISGCGEVTFSAHTRDNNVEDIRRALGAVRSSAGARRALAYLVTPGPKKELVGFDLDAGKILWRESADVRSRVVAFGSRIAHRQGDSELVVRDARSGQVALRIRLEPSERFAGAALDEERLYYVVQKTAAQRTSLVIAVDWSGRELWRMPAQGSLGAPAARGGVVAVPFLRQNLSLLDGRTGKELARVRATDEQITFVRALPSGFFYGGAGGVFLLDEKSADGSRSGSSYVQARFGSDQVRTFYYWDGYELQQADYSAFDRNRLLWRAEPRAGSVAFADDQAILYSYRYLFAFDSASGKLRWAYAHPRVDVVAAEAEGPSIVFSSADGEVGALDAATGAVRVRYKTGLRIAGATFDAEGFAGGSSSGKADVLKTLEQIVWDPDARFTAVKVFAVTAIGELPGETATSALVKIVVKDSGVSPVVQKQAGEKLVSRKDKAALPIFLDALKQHYDYLEGRAPHGIDVLARALAQLESKEAVAELAAHLFDPATTHAALKELAAALVAVAPGGAKPALRALDEFLLTYRCDPMFLADPSPLTLAAEGLLKEGGQAGRRTVEYVAGEGRTLPPVQRYLEKALAR